MTSISMCLNINSSGEFVDSELAREAVYILKVYLDLDFVMWTSKLFLSGEYNRKNIGLCVLKATLLVVPI